MKIEDLTLKAIKSICAKNGDDCEKCKLFGTCYELFESGIPCEWDSSELEKELAKGEH